MVSPIVPAFYAQPTTIDDIINHSVGRLLDLFDLNVGVVDRWKDFPDAMRIATAGDEIYRCPSTDLSVLRKILRTRVFGRLQKHLMALFQGVNLMASSRDLF